MLKNVVRFSLFSLLGLGVLFWASGDIRADISSVTVPPNPVAESDDFATMVIGDPWDMNEYSDVSQYINEAGERTVIANPTVANDIFTGRSLGSVATPNNGWFHVLFPGYETAIHVGKTGSRYPIETAKYGCIYMAMRVESPAANQFGPDQYRVFWWGDDRLNTQNAPYGFTQGIALYPEYGAAQPNPIWKLYKIDLENTPLGDPNQIRWQDRAEWQGIRIDPTINEGVNYGVDWVRLTGCQANNVPITFTPDAGITAVWLTPRDTNRQILIATDVNGASGTYDLDIQGVEAGEYKVGFGSVTNCCTTESTDYLTINQTPIVDFVNPTWYSGEDFATASGNAWDMDSGGDITGIDCVVNPQFVDGELRFTTPPNTQQPPECLGAPPESVADPKIFLNMPNGATIDPSEYRYLSFRMFDELPWQRIPRGSMMRWVWTVQGDSNRPGFECHLVSHDVAYDVGWNTYTIDLWGAFSGSAEEWAGECESLPKSWLGHTEILKARFDPDENITDENFNKRIDWIRVTKPNVVKSGALYPLGLNKFFTDDTFDVTLYYTTNRNQPKQHLVVLDNNGGGGGGNPPSMGPNNLFLPIVYGKALPTSAFPSDLSYLWDTTGVGGGEYYICAEVTDGLNTATYCSLATITVNP